VSDRLLIVALNEESHLPKETHLLLSQRLVLRAIRESRATRIAFWEAQQLARSFGCDAQNGQPDIGNLHLLTVLGNPSWIALEASPWTQVLSPSSSMTTYIKKRVKPVRRAVGLLMQMGLTQSLADKLLGLGGDLQGLRSEAERVLQGLEQKKKLKEMNTYFKRRKDVEMVINVDEVSTIEVATHMVSKVLQDA
jgi:hypothetical protein